MIGVHHLLLRQAQHDNVNVLSNQNRNFMECHANGVIGSSRYHVAEKSLRRAMRGKHEHSHYRGLA